MSTNFTQNNEQYLTQSIEQNLKQNRIWEIDYLRALAILLMVVYHTVYDLNVFFKLDINYKSSFWYWEGKTAALLFIMLSGISCGLSKRNTIITGLKLLGLGMIITVVTYFALDKMYIRFGILHFLGVCMILYPLLKTFNSYSLITIAVVNAILALPFKAMIVNTYLLLPLGLRHSGFRSADYYPISPYLSVFILGILLYKVYYYQRKSLFSENISNYVFNSRMNKYINKFSKHSLLIYMVHQPIVLAILYLIFKII